MLTNITRRLTSWSRERLAEYTNGAELPLFEDKSTYIQEYADNGLYVYNQTYAKFYGDNGRIISLSSVFTKQDPEIYQLLHTRSIGTKFIFYKLIAHERIVIDNVEYMYLEFDGIDGNVGVPFIAWGSLSTLDLLHWMEQVEFMIVTLKEHRLPFPSDAINFNKLVKVKSTGEFALCPIAGPNNWRFDFDCNEFLKEQMRRLIHTKQIITVDTGEDKPVDVDWELLRQQAKVLWWRHKV